MLFKKQIETHLYNEIHSEREREQILYTFFAILAPRLMEHFTRGTLTVSIRLIGKPFVSSPAELFYK